MTRGAQGRQVFYWYHRQFIEAANDRYCQDQAFVAEIHAGLADYFAGTWSGGDAFCMIDSFLSK